MQKANTKDNSPRTVWAEYRRKVQEREKLVAGEAAAEQRVSAAETALDSTRAALAAAQAEAVLSGEDLGREHPTSKAFYEAIAQLETARAGLAGIRQKYGDLDSETPGLVERLAAERQSYNSERVRAFVEQRLVPAFEALKPILQEAAALESALGLEIPEAHRLPDAGDWRNSETASEQYHQNSEPRELSEKLTQFARAANARRQMRDRMRARRAHFDPTARYKVIRPFLSYGRKFDVGDFVDSFKLDVRTLSAMFEARHLEPVTREQEYTIGSAEAAS